MFLNDLLFFASIGIRRRFVCSESASNRSSLTVGTRSGRPADTLPVQAPRLADGGRQLRQNASARPCATVRLSTRPATSARSRSWEWDELDSGDARISWRSPLARAVLTVAVGDTIIVHGRRGASRFCI